MPRSRSAPRLRSTEPTGSGLTGGGIYLLHRGKDGFETAVDAREVRAGGRDARHVPRPTATRRRALDPERARGRHPGRARRWALGRRALRQAADLQQPQARNPHRERGLPAAGEAAERDPVKAGPVRGRARGRAQLAARGRGTAGRGDDPPAGARRTLEIIAASGAGPSTRASFAAAWSPAVRATAASGPQKTSPVPAPSSASRSTFRYPARPSSARRRRAPAAHDARRRLRHPRRLRLRVPTACARHLVIEALRRAYRDRAEYLGDPDFVKIPGEQLLSPITRRALRASMRLDRATPAERAAAGVRRASEGPSRPRLLGARPEGNRVAATITVNFVLRRGLCRAGHGLSPQ